MDMERTERMSVTRRGLLRAAGVAAAAAVAAGCTGNVAPRRSTTAPTIGRRVHRVLTCNILFDLPEQKGTPFDWAAGRREACLNLIREQHAHLICLQEVGRGQNDDFIRAFPGFAAFGYDDPYVDRLPKRFQNIKNVILFARDRYDLVTGGQYWLSATPLVPGSRLAGEGLPRHVTWVRLKDRATGRQFRVLDTHFGLKESTRLQEAPMIAADTRPYADDFPQLLCGDFNSDSASAEHRVLHEAGWKDTYAAVHPDGDPATGPSASSRPATKPALPHRIDYIYVRGQVRPTAARIIRGDDHGRPASDHPFVSADVEM